MADAPAPGRPMKFPYTFSAKIAQFPIKFYFQKQWIWRYYFIALVASLPVFYKIDRLGKSQNIFSCFTNNLKYFFLFQPIHLVIKPNGLNPRQRKQLNIIIKLYLFN